MKRVLCIFLCLCCFVGMVGCSAHRSTPKNTVAVYYKREKPVYGTADGVIAEVQLDSTDHENEYVYLLNQYLMSTPEDGLTLPFPKGVSLVGFKLEGLTAKVIFSNRLADLTGMNLTIALICLTQTIMSVTGCHEVIISAASMQLDGQNFVTLNRDSYLLLDDSGAAQE